MKTMYITEAKTYADCEGRRTKWEAVTGYITYEEAKAVANAIVKTAFSIGDWRIMARTIDEATFTVKDEVVETFDWWKEIGRKEDAKRMTEIYAKKVAEAKAIKAKTEKGEARKAKKIAEAEAELARYIAIVEG